MSSTPQNYSTHDVDALLKVTVDSVCKDALMRPDVMPTTAHTCMWHGKHSFAITAKMKLPKRARCFFCSWDDAVSAFAKDPLEILVALSQPKNIRLVLLKSSMSQQTIKNIIKTSNIILHDLNFSSRVAQWRHIYTISYLKSTPGLPKPTTQSV